MSHTKGESVGIYFADIVVEEKLVLELKCAERLGPDHMAQCMNYLKASGKDVCLLVNFQSQRVEWKRILRQGVFIRLDPLLSEPKGLG
jgi:GxxExxY protein